MALTKNLKRTGAAGASHARQKRNENLEALYNAPFTPIEQEVREKIAFLKAEMSDADYWEFYKKTPMVDRLLLPVLKKKILDLEKEKEFYAKVESIREQAGRIIHSLPKTISVEKRIPPHDFFLCSCLCYEDGGFIAELPKSKLSQNMIMQILGYEYPRHNSGVVLYTRVKGCKGLETIEIVYQAEEENEPLF